MPRAKEGPGGSVLGTGPKSEDIPLRTGLLKTCGMCLVGRETAERGRKPENDQSENWVRTTKISGSEIAGKSAEKSANLMFGK